MKMSFPLCRLPFLLNEIFKTVKFIRTSGIFRVFVHPKKGEKNARVFSMCILLQK